MSKFILTPAVKAAIFSYVEAAIASAVILIINDAQAHVPLVPVDLFWALAGGLLGPLTKFINPLDKAFGIGAIKVPDAPVANNEVTAAIADAVAKEVTDKLEAAVTPTLDAVAPKVADAVAPVVDAVTPVIEAVTNPTQSN
jgi:hypothetical protein